MNKQNDYKEFIVCRYELRIGDTIIEKHIGLPDEPIRKVDDGLIRDEEDLSFWKDEADENITYSPSNKPPPYPNHRCQLTIRRKK